MLRADNDFTNITSVGPWQDKPDNVADRLDRIRYGDCVGSREIQALHEAAIILRQFRFFNPDGSRKANPVPISDKRQVGQAAEGTKD